MINKYEIYYETIDEITQFLKRDLIGPVSSSEVLIGVAPTDSYAIGKLWPRSLSTEEKIEDEMDLDGVAHRNEEGVEDSLETRNDVMTKVHEYKPTTMGLSVTLPPKATKMEFSFSFGKYTYSEQTIKVKSTSDELEKERKEKRYQHHPYSFTGTFDIPSETCQIKWSQGDWLEKHGVEIIFTIRKVMEDQSKLATITVGNQLQAPNMGIAQNESTLFQVRLTVSCQYPFLPVYKQDTSSFDTLEAQCVQMLYRNEKNYAYGHGCGTFYNKKGEQVWEISTDVMPTEKVFQMMPGGVTCPETMQLLFLSEQPVEEVTKALTFFISEYEVWLVNQRKEGAKLPDYQEAVNHSLEKISLCISRLKNGIRCLENSNALRAFQLMNEAMLLQRVNTKGANPETVFWFPFQLAYILQIIPDMVDPNSEHRDLVDLLWFPTGGGKTEAYLGVAAFTIFYRRITRNNPSEGVTIFMRYTLRLLTAQQFERSAALICACEYLRQRESISGEEISIGLWIGGSTTPNSLKIAEEKLEKIRKQENISEGNPMQVTKCPWCGHELDVTGYTLSKDGMSISCLYQSCPFYEHLPIYVVDDDIYMKKPTLLLSTVDKFARVTWDPRTRELFQEGNMAPDLVIQDELHLISGPLGSLTGIYEMALEFLCGGANRPKVIASTATVKCANKQIKQLYHRPMFQFPPSGISSEDSFFAIRASTAERPARTYIGLCETGGSLTDLFIRVYADLFFLKKLFIKQNKPTEVIDHFYTTVGYFNAIKDLGGSSSILADRVRTHIRSLFSRKFQSDADAVGLNSSDLNYYFNNAELTSRNKPQEIKETLERLDMSYPDERCYSYVLASNMLSVGIDVNRLGVMTVYGQPKSNAEYIQATSRVGRQNPGLVLALYNGQRSRDKSHYEQFAFYHKSFYQYVEATSVTPFSIRAIEKALHCVFVTLVRHTVKNMLANDQAKNFRQNLVGVSEINSFILQRIEQIYPNSFEIAEEWLADVAKEWEFLALTHGDRLYYQAPSLENDNCVSLLYGGSQQEDKRYFAPTLNALRNVEQTSNIYIKNR